MKTTPRFWLATLFAILPLTAFADWNEISSFDDGMRVFVNTGTVERIEGERLCIMRTRFRAPERDRAARVQMVTNHGTFTVELAASQIVSHAFR